jgi:hypothetical protein
MTDLFPLDQLEDDQTVDPNEVEAYFATLNGGPSHTEDAVRYVLWVVGQFDGTSSLSMIRMGMKHF